MQKNREEKAAAAGHREVNTDSSALRKFTGTNQEVTSFLGSCLRWWIAGVVTVGSVPSVGLLADEAVNGLLLWSVMRAFWAVLSGFCWCLGAADHSFLPRFLRSARLVLVTAFTPLLLELADLRWLFCTSPMLVLSLRIVEPPNMSEIWRNHRRRCEIPPTLAALASKLLVNNQAWFSLSQRKFRVFVQLTITRKQKILSSKLLENWLVKLNKLSW